MNRRGFIAALFAPFVARFFPKNVIHENVDVQHLWEDNGPIISNIVTSARQDHGRIDFINFKDWYRVEVRPLNYYDADMRTRPLPSSEHIKAHDARHAAMGLYVPDRPWSEA